ncbi:tyrosine-type recombinase/integrase [Halobacterium yunchengense]|uniref:tyrosine-type recombinase/integrase n=1 Tax=Halobacterium yunchengense TaxID=3108497 RepID=UPI003008C179
MYLEARKNEVSESTLSGYHYRLKHFIRWCQDVEGLDNLNDLSGRDLQRFKTWRRDDGGLKPITLQGQLDALRIFIRWCGSIDAVEQDLHEKFDALMPELKKTDEQSESILRSDAAGELLEYQRKFEWASRAHVIMELLWHTGIRLGTLHSLDVDDYDPDGERVELHHRPDTGTPLKNGREGERMIALDAEICRLLEDWIEQNRHPVEDDEGREPLLTSRNGRMNRSSIRDAVYRVTRPCFYAECPKGRDPDNCEGGSYGGYSKCPVNVSPHDVRRGSITYFLTEDVPEKVVSDRMNVGQDVLDKHYDKRDEAVKVEQRRGYLDNI